jgi:hypothetical protein
MLKRNYKLGNFTYFDFVPILLPYVQERAII